ncbi:hypothetical protein SAMN05519103_09533 [Rhizobiales bacterium GAS113]|nr:hypothetical protein SAMN05519103_09533 [Rhizobiales bacterium GAS113]
MIFLGAYDPDQVRLLAAALDAAWCELKADDCGPMSEAKKSKLIAALTKNLLAAAGSGQRDPGKLKLLALSGVARHFVASSLLQE